MKTKTWILLISAVLAVCLGASAWVLRPQEASRYALITSQGEHIESLDLSQGGVYTIKLPDGGYNVLTVQDGKIAVTDASCPDHYCMKRGFLNSGTDIVCLPNRLVISFLGDVAIVDAAVG